VHYGNPDARTDRSDLGQGTLSEFSGSSSEWTQIMHCMTDIMSQFNIQVTDQDPGSTPHFEVMVAGSASQILGSGSQGVLGVADFLCQSPGNCGSGYIPNALVFDFANDWPQYGGGVSEICGTAAQEIAHAWSLDHTTPSTDPMTYNQYPSNPSSLHYQDNAPCGSDCQGGQSPFGLQCSGQNHTCMSSGQSTQDEVQTILGLFGPNNGGAPDTTAPSVAITAPGDGATVMPGFAVSANITDDTAVQTVELRIDNQLVGGALTSAPWAWTAPGSLGAGSHNVEVTGYDAAGNSAKDAVDVTIGSMCTDSCMDPNQVCVNGHCEDGPSMPGGLGSTCTDSSDCASGTCASDGQGHMYCVDTCDPANDACPSGFTCMAAGSTGVCWPGADTGNGDGGKTGGCNTGGGGSGPILLGLGFAALLFKRRRRA
jgi:uncharacterized protein (TIGR03382 family)